MGRSLKGPFVDEHLMKKLKLKQTTKRKKLSKLGHVVQRFSQVSLTIAVYDDVNTYLFTSKKTWGHELGEFAPTRTYKGHAADDKKTENKENINGRNYFS